ncbi:MAG: hypothetical protein R3F49_19715 [Planctomycetota bacterium]
MKTSRILPVVLALGLVAGCNKSDANAAAGDVTKSVGDAAKGLAEKAQSAFGGLKDLDLSKISSLDPAKLQEMGKTAMSTLATQLGSIKDVASAEGFKGMVEPMLEKLTGLKTALGGKLPDMETLKSALGSLTTKFPSGSEVMNVLKPVIEKLTSLVG